MKRIYVATRARGFLLDLFEFQSENLTFVYSRNKIYETNSFLKTMLSKLVKSGFADHFGLIQRVKVMKKDCQVVFSYNRFIESDIAYVIYVENPLALVHYSTNRPRTHLGKKHIHKYFNDPNLKAIICLSKACYDTFDNFYLRPPDLPKMQIYPLVRSNPLVTAATIKEKCNFKELNCLYISSDFSLKGGRDILEAFDKLRDAGLTNIKLNVITRKSYLEPRIKQMIADNGNVFLHDFTFGKEELEAFYAQSCVYLNPTRQDSFSLVTLEAMKAGNAILATDLYALPEMVTDGHNGFVTNPKYRFFNEDNMPNEDVWNNRKKTIYSDYVDCKIVDFLFRELSFLDNNRDILEMMALNSYDRSLGHEFDSASIFNKWDKLLNSI